MSHDKDANAAEAELLRWAMEYARVQSCKADLEPGKFVLISREDFWTLVEMKASMNLNFRINVEDEYTAVPKKLADEIRKIKFLELDGKAAEEPETPKQQLCGQHVGLGLQCELPRFHSGRCVVPDSLNGDDSPAPIEDLELEVAACGKPIESANWDARCGRPTGHNDMCAVLPNQCDGVFVDGSQCVLVESHAGSCRGPL